MRYSTLLQIIAKENGTTPEEVHKEMKEALHLAGYDIEPEVFISLAVAKVKSEMNKR